MTPYKYLEKRTDAFPRKRFLGVAGYQVAVGILFILLGIGDLTSNLIRMRGPDCEFQTDYVDDVMDDIMDADPEMYGDEIPEIGRGMSSRQMWGGVCDGQSSAAFLGANLAMILSSFFYLIAGGLGLGAARTPVAHRKSGLKTGFMVMSIVNALFFGLLLAAAGVNTCMFTAYPPNGLFARDYYWKLTLGGITAIFGFAAWILSIVSASMACCCAPVEEIQYVAVPQEVAPFPSSQFGEKKDISFA